MTRRMHTLAALVAAASLVTLFGCGGGGTGPTAPPPAPVTWTLLENRPDGFKAKSSLGQVLDCLYKFGVWTGSEFDELGEWLTLGDAGNAVVTERGRYFGFWLEEKTTHQRVDIFPFTCSLKGPDGTAIPVADNRIGMWHPNVAGNCQFALTVPWGTTASGQALNINAARTVIVPKFDVTLRTPGTDPQPLGTRGIYYQGASGAQVLVAIRDSTDPQAAPAPEAPSVRVTTLTGTEIPAGEGADATWNRIDGQSAVIRLNRGINKIWVANTPDGRCTPAIIQILPAGAASAAADRGRAARLFVPPLPGTSRV